MKEKSCLSSDPQIIVLTIFLVGENIKKTPQTQRNLQEKKFLVVRCILGQQEGI